MSLLLEIHVNVNPYLVVNWVYAKTTSVRLQNKSSKIMPPSGGQPAGQLTLIFR